MEFSVTDGRNWTEIYVIEFEVKAAWQNRPMSFFNEVSPGVRLPAWHEVAVEAQWSHVRTPTWNLAGSTMMSH